MYRAIINAVATAISRVAVVELIYAVEFNTQAGLWRVKIPKFIGGGAIRGVKRSYSELFLSDAVHVTTLRMKMYLFPRANKLNLILTKCPNLALSNNGPYTQILSARSET